MNATRQDTVIYSRPQPTAQSSGPRPRFPSMLAMPLRAVPAGVHGRMLAYALNRLFRDELAEGELDFLQDRIVGVCIEDAAIRYLLTLNNHRFESCGSGRTADLALNGTLYDYMLLASRREDADTLFFNRQLRISGDTELGLYVKNFLDSVDLEARTIPGFFIALLQQNLPLYERLFDTKQP